MDPLSFSFRKCSHEKAKDSTKEDNSETLRQIMELDLRETLFFYQLVNAIRQ